MVWPALIAAGASLASGAMQARNARRQSAMQKEFAQQGVQWKVEDAKKAGIHPLYALGASTISYSPVQVGDYGLGQMGQDLSRAFASSASQDTRDRLGEFITQKVAAQDERDFSREMRGIQLEQARIGLQRSEIDLAIANSQLARINQPGTGKPIPTDGGQGLVPPPVNPVVPSDLRRGPTSGKSEVPPRSAASPNLERDIWPASRKIESSFMGYPMYFSWPGKGMSEGDNELLQAVSGIPYMLSWPYEAYQQYKSYNKYVQAPSWMKYWNRYQNWRDENARRGHAR